MIDFKSTNPEELAEFASLSDYCECCEALELCMHGLIDHCGFDGRKPEWGEVKHPANIIENKEVVYQNACIQRSIDRVERAMLDLLKEMYPNEKITTREEMIEISELNTHTFFFADAMDHFTSLYNECYKKCVSPDEKSGDVD